MAEIEIRNTISTDLARLMTIEHAVDTDYVWQLDLSRDSGQVSAAFREVRLPRTVQVHHPRTAKQLADTWHVRPMLSAMNGMEAIAYIRFTDAIMSHAVWITDVMVAKAWRRRGIARKLIAAAENWGNQHELRLAIIEVQSKNYPAIRLIQKLGYEFCGYNDQYYSTRDVALFFSRTI
jgi:ribosomal protein S18 acetylase RimI-like enzyme